MNTQAAENINEITPKQLEEARRLGKILRHFLVADTVLVLFLTFGYAFPSKIEKLQTSDADATYRASYENVAKSSPLDIKRESARTARVQVPRLSARNMPLPVAMPVRNTLSFEDRSPADAEADLTMKRRTT